MDNQNADNDHDRESDDEWPIFGSDGVIKKGGRRGEEGEEHGEQDRRESHDGFLGWGRRFGLGGAGIPACLLGGKTRMSAPPRSVSLLLRERHLFAARQVRDQVAHLLGLQLVEQAVGHDRLVRRLARLKAPHL